MHTRIEQFVPNGTKLLNPLRHTQQAFNLAAAALAYTTSPGTLRQRFRVLDHRSKPRDNRTGPAADTATDFCQETVMQVACLNESRFLVPGLLFYWVFYSDRIVDRTIHLDPYAQLILSYESSAVMLYNEMLPSLVPDSFKRQLRETSLLVSDACQNAAVDIQRVYMQHTQRLANQNNN